MTEDKQTAMRAASVSSSRGEDSFRFAASSRHGGSRRGYQTYRSYQDSLRKLSGSQSNSQTPNALPRRATTFRPSAGEGHDDSRDSIEPLSIRRFSTAIFEAKNIFKKRLVRGREGTANSPEVSAGDSWPTVTLENLSSTLQVARQNFQDFKMRRLSTGRGEMKSQSGCGGDQARKSKSQCFFLHFYL